MTPVTVIEAGPCPVVQVKTGRHGRLRRRPARVRRGRRAEALARASSATSSKGGCRRRIAGWSSSAAASELTVGRHRHRRGVPARRRGQGRGHLDRQGLRRHDQAPQLPPRPEVARLAQHPQARLDRRVGDPVARLQGHAHGRPAGRQATSPSSASSSTTSTRSGTCCSSRARCRARRTASSRSGRRSRMAAKPLPRLRCWTTAGKASKQVDARRRRVRRRGQAAPRARGGARRAERRPRGHARREEPRHSSPAAARSRGARRAPAAPARARAARRTGPAAASPSRPHAELRVQGQPQGAARRDSRRASLLTQREGTLALVRRRRLRRSRPPEAPRLSWPRGARSARSVVVVTRRRGRGRSSRSGTSHGVAVTTPEELEVSAVVWARSLLVSEQALPVVAGPTRRLGR